MSVKERLIALKMIEKEKNNSKLFKKIKVDVKMINSQGDKFVKRVSKEEKEGIV